MSTINIYFDGSSKPPNGTGNTRGGFVFLYNGVVFHKDAKNFGHGSNNYAEFKALLFALTTAYQMGFYKANCYGDSTTVIDAMNGVSILKPITLLSVYMEIEEIINKFKWVSFMYVKRNSGYHKLADQLSKF